MAKPVKVLRIIARLNVGGPALHCVLLSENMAQQGYQTALVTGSPSETEADFEEVYSLKPKNFQLIKLKKMKRKITGLGDLWTLLELIQIIRREKPDIVHTHTAKAGTLGRIAAFLTGVPVVVHTFHGHVLRGYFSPLFSKLICQIERLLAKKTTAIVTLSEGLRHELSSVFRLAPLEKFKVIPLGRELNSFFQNSNFLGKLKEEMNLDADSFLIGIIGRLVPIKNHVLLLEALAQLPRGWDWHLAIVGEGEEKERLVEKVNELGLTQKVHFLGWRSDLEKVYAGLDLFVLSSDNEGTPLSIIESFASGVPVVATDVGGVKDMLTRGESRNGLSLYSEGILVPRGDKEALTKAIRFLEEEPDLRRQMGIKARLRANDYSQENLTARMDSLYKNLLVNHA